LIIGDNYDALNNLIAAGYKNKIDIIYIDPPYGMNSEGEFADTNYDNKLERDSLLSMLEPRLELAKQLLSDEGVIFCSITNNNVAHFKLIFDKTFTEKCFIGNLI
jgi:adenine-specific DNA-methyltransferase